MTLADKIRFYDQLGTMVKAGMPIRGALDKLGTRMGSPEIAALSSALGQHADAREAFQAAGFTPFEVNLVAAGERGGRLDHVFRQLAVYFKRERDVARALLGALVYPVFLLHVVAIVLPLPKLILDSFGVYIRQVGWSLGILWLAGIGAYEGIRLSWKSTAVQSVWMAIPLVRGFLRSTYAFRWVVALRIEIAAGIPFYQAAADAWRATGYADGDAVAEQARERMLHGEALSSLMTEWSRLPRDWADYMATAEESGKLDETLETLEELARGDWQVAQERLQKWMPKILYALLIILAAYQVFSSVIGNYFKILGELDKMPI